MPARSPLSGSPGEAIGQPISTFVKYLDSDTGVVAGEEENYL